MVERRSWYSSAAIAGAVVVIAVASYFMQRSYREAQRLARAQHLDQQALTTRQSARAIEETFRLLGRELEHLAGNPAIRRAGPAAARAAMEESFRYVRNLSVNDISRSDARGIVQDTVTSPGLVGRDFSFREYFKALKGGAPGPVYEFITFEGLRKGSKGIIVARSILDESERFAGPIVFIVEVSDLIERHLTALPAGMRGWVVDADGIVLFHPELAAGTRIGDGPALGPRFADFLSRLRSERDPRGEYRRQAPAAAATLATAESMTVAGKRLVVVLEAPEEIVQKSLSDFKTDTILGTGISLVALLGSALAIIVLIAKGKRDLEREIAERRTLEHQLRHAQKMECFGRLAGGVAHDFNNILTAIIGYCELLGDRLEKDSPLRSYVDTILHAASSAARLTGSLLAFSSRQVLHPRFMDVNEAVRNAGKLMARLVGEDISIQVAPGALDVGIVADPGQVEQVLMNLAANARDAMPKGGTIRIATAVENIEDVAAARVGVPRPGAYVRLTFSDTGVGMDEATLERVFEPFFTTKEAGKGTGLGLAIVYGIVAQHRGAVGVRSSPGHGTSFEIHLPAARFPEEGERLQDEFSPDGLERGSECILLVEDNASVRETVGAILRSAGYRVLEAGNGAEALELFAARGEEIALAVLDVVMPGTSGVEVFRELRAAKPGVKVLFLSGYAQERLHDPAILSAEGVGYLPKPVSRRRLLARVRELIEGRPPGVSVMRRG